MRWHCVFALLICSLSIHTLIAQVTVSAIVEPVEPGGDTTEIYERYSFPHVESSDAKVAHKINEHLLLNALYISVDSIHGSIFEQVRRSEEWPVPPIAFTLFNVVYNQKNVLSLDIAGEWCGAYCEGYTSHYNYDTQTGAPITFASLFTTEGLQVINDSIVKWKRAEIAAQIQLLQGTKTFNHEDSIDKVEAIEMYKDCLDDFTEAFFGPAHYQDYNITSIGFIIYQSRCSEHYNLSLDELGEFDYRLSYKDYGKYLSPYGKALLAGRF